MRAGVLAAIGGTVVVLVATGPASAFNSGANPEGYYGPAISAVNNHRQWASNAEGAAYEASDSFTRRLPDDEFDSLLLSMINRYRSDSGLPEFIESEALRVQSAMWSNVIADRKDAKQVDWWSAQDVEVACNTVTDFYSAAAVSGGRPEDVFWDWMATPALRNALSAPGAAWVGIASVVDEAEYTTIRLVQGDCQSGALPYTPDVSTLPIPRLSVAVAPLASSVRVTVHRRGREQLWVSVHRLDNWHWVNERQIFVAPGQPSERVVLPPGRYRVSVPEQSGYARVFTAPFTLP